MFSLGWQGSLDPLPTTVQHTVVVSGDFLLLTPLVPKWPKVSASISIFEASRKVYELIQVVQMF